MSVQTKVHVECEGCGLKDVFDYMGLAREAGWLTVTARPIGFSANDATGRSAEVCSAECVGIWASS